MTDCLGKDSRIHVSYGDGNSSKPFVRRQIAHNIRDTIGLLNALLMQATDAGMGVYITDQATLQPVSQAYHRSPNEITHGVTLYVHAITYTTREDL